MRDLLCNPGTGPFSSPVIKKDRQRVALRFKRRGVPLASEVEVR